ncbi:hypothetical protein ABGV49_13255 [Chromobacterium vaccinii]|uniref:Uncharacterized protein n=1 Tax=Chromobacterium vaccinii TaxID=1108595 RepID=A0ABV0FD62_9NEIS
MQRLPWRGQPRWLTLTDIALRDGLIHCAYQLKFATRNHHAPAWDVLKTAGELMDSFVYGYLDDAERELLAACDACNRAVQAYREVAGGEVIRIASGQQLTIMLLGKDGVPCQHFTLSDLGAFTGLCRRYRSPQEVESLLQDIFAKVAHG